MKLIHKPPYQIIYCDPPWRYNRKECICENSIVNGKIDKAYETLSIKDIQSIPIIDICDKDCLLFMWVPNPLLEVGIETIKKWGFIFSTVAFVWYKINPNIGHYTMSDCELVLVGKRKWGRIPKGKEANNTRQFYSEKKTGHSKKPIEIRNRITNMFPDHPKLELFARTRGDGWDATGLEYDGLDILEFIDKVKNGH